MEKYGDGWRDYFEKTYPTIKINDEKDTNPDSPYLLFIYGIGADFTDPVVQEARGIIINEETKEVVCWPFRKFGRYDEPYADKIDWSTAEVQEKIDGSIIKLWFDKINKKWIFSTNACINAVNAPCKISANSTYTNYLELIESCYNFDIIQYKLKGLDTDKTYIFELTTPSNQVVVKYTRSRLFHIGTRSNITGKEYSTRDIGGYLSGIETAAEFVGLKNLDDCIAYLDMFTRDSDGRIIGCEFEGFVVVDKNFNRVKIKDPIYIVLHNIASNSETSVKLLVKYLIDGKLDITSLSEQFPELAHYLKYYDFRVTEFMNRANAFINITRTLYEKSSCDRKKIAMIIKDSEYASIGFKCIGNDKSLMEILECMKGGAVKSVLKHIRKYEPENFSNLFEKFYQVEKESEDNNE